MIRVTSTALNVGVLAYHSVQSVVDQTYKEWTLDFHDAVSKDDTVTQALKARKDDARIRIHGEVYRTGPLDKLIPLWRSFDDNDVIVWLDGDDRLATNKVLEIVAKYHEEAVVTYGTFMTQDGVIWNLGPVSADPRSDTAWRASHLKTFKAGAFKRIHDNDLRDADGAYYSLSIDRCIMLPLLEMFPEKSKHVPNIMYLYNWNVSYELTATPAEIAKADAVTRRIYTQQRYKRVA